MKKWFYLTKDFFEKELGIRNVCECKNVVSVVNGKAVFAKTHLWRSLDELKNDDIITDTKATDGVLFFYSKHPKDSVDIGVTNYTEYTDDYNEAERFEVRLFIFE